MVNKEVTHQGGARTGGRGGNGQEARSAVTARKCTPQTARKYTHGPQRNTDGERGGGRGRRASDRGEAAGRQNGRPRRRPNEVGAPHKGRGRGEKEGGARAQERAGHEREARAERTGGQDRRKKGPEKGGPENGSAGRTDRPSGRGAAEGRRGRRRQKRAEHRHAEAGRRTERQTGVRHRTEGRRHGDRHARGRRGQRGRAGTTPAAAGRQGRRETQRRRSTAGAQPPMARAAHATHRPAGASAISVAGKRCVKGIVCFLSPFISLSSKPHQLCVWVGW